MDGSRVCGSADVPSTVSTIAVADDEAQTTRKVRRRPPLGIRLNPTGAPIPFSCSALTAHRRPMPHRTAVRPIGVVGPIGSAAGSPKGNLQRCIALEASKPDRADPSATDTRSGEACRKPPPATPEQRPTGHPIHLERHHRPVSRQADSPSRAHPRTNSDRPSARERGQTPIAATERGSRRPATMVWAFCA